MVAATLFLLFGCHSEDDTPRQLEGAMSSTKETSRMSESPDMLLIKEANATAKMVSCKEDSANMGVAVGVGSGGEDSGRRGTG